MISVEFAASLQRHLPPGRACPVQSVAATSLREALEAALHHVPELASYVFNDQRAVRQHVAVFINRVMVQDRAQLNQPLQPGDKVLVIQALTGG